MSSLIHKLQKKGLITPPSFLASNVQYETIMGSMAYGVNKDESDEDVYGFCIPPKEIIFPHLAGVIPGFDKQYERFDHYQQHHIKFSEKKEYDIVIYNIVKYFRLCADGNPNMIDSLFTPANCIKTCTQVGNMVRENRKIFLSKKCWHTFKGYAYSQMSKIRSGANKSNPKRQENINKFGYDLKFSYHLVRLINEVEQILVEGDLDLQRNREQLKSIRKGEWTLEEVESYFKDKERDLEKVYLASKAVPDLIQEVEIKQLLIDCLEHHYGSLEKAIVAPDRATKALSDIKKVIDTYYR
jgi:predicted nucleotidyltransferase